MYFFRITRKQLCIALVLTLSSTATVFAEDPNIQQIYSWKEYIKVYPSGMQFKAKLDSGAKTSSINATEIENFERDGEKWVRYVIENDEGEKKTLERKIIRMVRIKEHDGSTQRRPVVKMGICLGSLYKEVEVNLIDRTHLSTGMLVGRTFMEDDVLVDPSTTYSHTPECNRKPIDK